MASRTPDLQTLTFHKRAPRLRRRGQAVGRPGSVGLRARRPTPTPSSAIECASWTRAANLCSKKTPGP